MMNKIMDGGTENTQTSSTTMDLEPFSVGAWDDGANWVRFCRLDVAELIMIKSAVSDDTREKIEGYLAHKWGLTLELPAGHPYKSSQPTQ